MKKKLIKTIVILIVLAFLLIPAINPFLDDAGKAAVSAQIQNTFGGLIGGSGMLTPANLICAAAVILLVWLACDLVIVILNWSAKKHHKSRSMVGLFVSLTKFLGFIVGAVWALSILGVNLTGIFASLGIVSLIIGFGAQSLIEDIITGLFIIFEGKYSIGDIIVLDDFRGVVRDIGVRTTTIEDAGYNLKVVNNSDIRNFQNRSRNTSLAVCLCSVAYETDLRALEKMLSENLPDMYLARKDLYLGAPRYLGVHELGDSGVVLKFVADVKEEDIFAAQRALNRDIRVLFADKGVEIPFPQVVVHDGDK